MRFLFFIFLLLSSPSFGLTLGNPVDCEIGKSCWLVNYVDHDNGKDWRDYMCFKQSYNKHQGTDIALDTLASMHKGVNVVAAADGVVKAVRKDMDDLGLSASEESLKGRACGNAVVLLHEDGWETMYCHMMRFSIPVSPGDRVKKGQKLGLIGLSGKTEFPHLHLTVRHLGEVIDPFTAGKVGPSCEAKNTTKGLWDDVTTKMFTYTSPAVYLKGFSAHPIQSFIARKKGFIKNPLSVQSPAIVFGADIIGLHPGDKIKMQIAGPDEKILIAKDFAVDKYKIRKFQFIGIKRADDKNWPIGEYRGTVSIYRKDQWIEYPSFKTKITK